MSNQEAPKRSRERINSGSAVGNSVIEFNDGAQNMELIGFTYYETEESTITWVWENGVLEQSVIIPYHRIEIVRTTFEATGAQI